jgi:hypothetical protein
MPTPDPKVKDASTQNQREVQGALNPFFINMIQNPMQSPFGQMLGAKDYEQRAFNATEPGLLRMFNQGLGPGTEFLDAYSPIAKNNLQFALGQLGSAAPMANSSALATQGIDATTQFGNAFNLFALQAKQNLLDQALGAAGQYGALAQGAGNAVAQRYINPLVQILQVASQYAQPRSEVYQPPGVMDYVTQGANAAAALMWGKGQWG